MQYIDNVYLINMIHSKQRLDNMQKQVHKLGKPFKRIEAIIGNQLSQSDIEKFATPWCQSFCTKAMIGIFLSHQKAWETIVKNNDKYALILEDDTHIVETFQNDLNNILQELNEKDPNWDFIYLGCFGACSKTRNYDIVSTIQKYIFPNIKDKREFTYSYVPETPVGFHCYVISQKCAQKLIIIMNKASYHVDVAFLNHSSQFRIYSSSKILGYQQSTSSNSTQTVNFPILANILLDNIQCDKGSNS